MEKNTHRSSSTPPVKQNDDALLLEQEEEDDFFTIEDRREMLNEINQIASKNKITISKDDLTLHPQKKGYLFPVVINVGAAVLLAINIVLILFALRRQNVEIITQNEQIDVSSQAALIAQIQEQSQNELAEREQNIADVELELQDLELQLSQVDDVTATRISQYGEQLEQDITNDIRAENLRLQAENLSETEIVRRIEIFENLKQQEFETSVNNFRRQIGIERSQLVQDIEEEIRQRGTQLDNITQQRDTILNEINTQLTANDQESLNDAQLRLQVLTRNQELEGQVLNQLAGYYNTILNAINQEDYETAQRNIDFFKTFLNGQLIATVPGLQGRRETDLLIVDSFALTVEMLLRQQGNEDIETRNIQTQQASDIYNQAQGAVQRGELQDALSNYLDIIENYPQNRNISQVSTSISNLFNRQLSQHGAERDSLANQLEGVQQLQSENTEGIQQQEDEIVQLTSELDSLNRQLNEQQEQFRQLIEQNDQNIQTQEEQLQSETARLRQFEDIQRQLRNEYITYRNNVANLTNNSDVNSRRIETKLRFDSFLSSEVVADTFPGINADVREFDAQFEEAGRESAIIQTTDVVFNLSRLDRNDERLQYIQDKMQDAEQEGDTNLSRFLNQLVRLFDNN